MLKGNSVDLRRPRIHRKDTLYPLHNAYVGLLQLSYGRCYPIFTPPAVAEPRSVLMMSFTMTRPFPQPGSFLSSMDFILVPRRLARRFRLRHSPLREACLYYLRSAIRSAIALFLVSTLLVDYHPIGGHHSSADVRPPRVCPFEVRLRDLRPRTLAG